MRNILIIGCLLSSLSSQAGVGEVEVTWIGLVPALIAIGLSVITKQVKLSLFSAVLVGSFLFYYKGGFESSVFFGFEKSIDKYIVNASSDSGHVSVIIFSFLIAGMVKILAKSKAMLSVVEKISSFAKNKRSALFSTYIMGVVVFFDDYANTLIVGNTMKGVTDKYRISREKLAYVVDATAAPIACVALVSTWIGFEVDLIDKGVSDNGLSDLTGTGYATFINSVLYSFYPIVTLIFVFLIIWMQRDFGPMLKFEQKANDVTVSKGVPIELPSIWNAVLPIVSLIAVSFLGIYLTGEGESISHRIQSGDSYKGLLWGSSFSLSVAIQLNIKKQGIKKCLHWMLDGMKELLPAIVILILAWSLNGVLEDLKLGDFLAWYVQEAGFDFVWLPVLTFVAAGLIAFATGSSFSTMSILFPIYISIAAPFLLQDIEVLNVFYCGIACVLSGAVLGDHCSPISDTTILSSMATGSDHINHVNSQMPYALIVGGISIILIVLSTVMSVSSIILIVLSFLLSYLIIRMLGKSI